MKAATYRWAVLFVGLADLLHGPSSGAATSRPKSAAAAKPVAGPSTSASPAPVALALSRISDRSVSVRFDRAQWPAGTTVRARNLLDQSITSLEAGASEGGPLFVLPAPWDGELMITRPAAPGSVVMPQFVAVVVTPVVAPPEGDRPRLIYGPRGLSIVRFSKEGAPPEGTQVFITSPPISAVEPPRKLAGDLVEIGLLPRSPLAITALVGLTPWSPPAKGQLVLNVYDPKGQRWTALPSHAARDGTVFATGPVPGAYSLTGPR